MLYGEVRARGDRLGRVVELEGGMKSQEEDQEDTEKEKRRYGKKGRGKGMGVAGRRLRSGHLRPPRTPASWARCAPVRSSGCRADRISSSRASSICRRATIRSRASSKAAG